MNPGSKIRFADFEADLATGELRKHGFRVRLQEKPFQVLTAMLERPGELVSREDLHQRLWGADTFVDFDNNLNTAIYKLREALGDTAEAPHLVETLPKKGYRFIGALLAPEAAGGLAGPLPAPAFSWRLPAASAALLILVALAGYFAFNTNSSSAMASSKDPSAREAYLKGRYLLGQGRPESGKLAIPFFEQAMALDANFAEARAGLADALSMAPGPRGENILRARAEAQKAIALNPKLAEAHHRLASIYLYDDWDWDAARQAFERAVALAPDSPAIHHSYAGYFSLLGQHERAREEMQRAMELDSVSVAVSADAGWYWFVARRPDESIAQSRKALQLEPQHRGAHYYVLLALIEKKDWVEARRWAVKYLVILGATRDELARAVAGTPEEGLREFWKIRLAGARQRLQAEPSAMSDVALAHAALGETENALDCLEKIYQQHSGWLLPFLRVYPPLDALRTHPRFLALQQKMNFPPHR